MSDPTPEDDLRALILAEMSRIDGANKNTVDKRVKDLIELDMNRRTLTYAGVKRGDKDDEGKTTTKDVHFRDIDAYFSNACRRLPEGSGAWYSSNWSHRTCRPRRPRCGSSQSRNCRTSISP